MKHLLGNPIDKMHKLEMSSVYKIVCGNCRKATNLSGKTVVNARNVSDETIIVFRYLNMDLIRSCGT